jgi:nitrogen-specific signal transduction histidine kinase/CheY-like chemotaxis protein
VSRNPTPRRLNALDLTVRLGGPSAQRAVADKETVRDTDPGDDDVVSLRSQALRAPLANMVGFAELIASSDLTKDQRQLYMASLLREGRRLTALIDNALVLHRLESGHRDLDLAPVEIRSLILRAVAAAGDDNQRPIEIHIPDKLPLVSADAEAILEVLANFLSNARAFSPHGGDITIDARAAGDMVEVSIRDHGVGVEPEEIPRLFRKFYRADSGVRRRSPGSGMGLAINHRIIEAHGGQVSATSKGAGKGTRFQFTLPVARQVTGSGYILIVEDDAGFASLIKAEFATLGLDTVRAADAETAQHMLVDTTPRAIVLDLRLPGLQGEDFLAHIRTGFGMRLPVVVLTAKELLPAEISALETAGAMAVLPKEAGAPQAAVALIAGVLALDAESV